MEAADALLKLGVEFTDRGCYPQAAKCFLAVCGSQALPATIATARLLLGQVLLDHTHDVAQAKEHLTAAELLLRSTPGNHLLRCETFDSLARCHGTLGALQQQKEAYTSGLAVCREGAQSKDREALARWAVYFHFKLAEYSLTRDSPSDALCALEGVGALPGLTPTEQVLHLLNRAYLGLHVSNYDSVTADLQACSALLDRVPDQQGLQARQLRVHLLILGASVALATGSLKDMELEESQPVSLLAQLQELVEGLRGAEWTYGWMPARQVEAAVALLQGSAYRNLGKPSQAAHHLARAEELVDAELAERQFNLQGTEGVLTPHALWSGKGFALLKVLLMEQHALVSLVRTDLEAAAHHISGLIGVLQRFPTLMRDFVPSARMLQGFYAQTLGEYGTAIAAFKSVLGYEDVPHLHPMAAITAALCELQRGASQAAVGRAAEVLEAAGISSRVDMADASQLRAAHDRALHQVVISLAALRADHAQTAKLQLARTLRLAHQVVADTQLVGTVLTALAPLQLEKGDVSGTRQLLDSALTILKGIKDLPSMLECTRGLVALQERMNKPDHAEQLRGYLQLKTQELEAAVAAARATEAHSLVLRWAPAAD